MSVNTERAFDALPHVVEIYEKLEMDKYIKKERVKNKGKKVDEINVGIDLFKHVLKNLNKAKEEVFEVVAVFEDKSVEEVKKQPLTKTLGSIKKLFGDEDLLGFFKSAM